MIRQAILEALKAQDQRHSLDLLRDRTLALVEDLQNQLTLDVPMQGWMPVGPDGQSTLSELLPEDLATLRRESTKAFYRSAHGRNVIRTMVKFIIGQGTVVDFHEKDEDTLEKITAWWRVFAKANRFFSLQREAVTRAFRDGECFIRRFLTPTGPLMLRFIDPDRIGSLEVPDGIETDPDDVETVLAYHVSRGGGAKAEKVPASDILHIKLNVDRNVKRGRPLLEPILPFLTKYAKWLDARMVLNIIRASVALVQEVTGSNTDLLRLRSAQRTTKSSPNETDKSKMLRPGTIIRGTPGTKYTMLSPNLDAKDAAEDGRTILLAIAAAAGLPDTFVTEDFCHSMETEVWAERGWLRFEDIRPTDKLATMHPETGELEFQEPLRLHSFHYTGEMYQFLGRRCSFCVTPQHDLLVADYHRGRKWIESLRFHERSLASYRKEKVSDLSAALYVVPASVTWQGEDQPIFTLPDGTTVEMDLWLEFLGYVITEGCVTESAGRVQITQKHPERTETIRQCLEALPWPYTTTISGGCSVFRIGDKRFREFVAHLIGTPEGVYARHKHLPAFVWTLAPAYLQVLLDALILGDGTVYPSSTPYGRAHMIYRTTSPRLGDEVHRVALMLGYTATHAVRVNSELANSPGLTQYHVQISDGHPQLLETKRLERVPWDAPVWCATVPNGLLITRHRGKPFISGNSKSNFASSVVAQNPAIREFEDHESVFAEYFGQIVEWVLQDGVEKDQIPLMVNAADGRRATDLDFDIAFPPLLRRDLNQEVQAYATMHDSRVISKRSWAIKIGLDPDEEQRLLSFEAETDPTPQGDVGMAKRKDAARNRLVAPKRPEDKGPRQQTTGAEGQSNGLAIE